MPDEPTPSFRCHVCNLTDLIEQPLAIRVVRRAGQVRWVHTTCGRLVCPSCGAPPAAGQALCASCHALVHTPTPQQ